MIATKKYLDCLEVGPATADYRIIWLHGLGADGHDFVPIVPALGLKAAPAVRFIFPHAPIMPVTVNQGQAMRAWYDIYGIDIGAKIDSAGINSSIEQVGQLIEREMAGGVPSHHIFLAGFSQGAVIAISAGLRYPKRLAGLIGLSGYLPLAEDVIREASPANRDTPIFLAHGTADPIVPYALGKMAEQALTQAGYTVAAHAYPMLHTVCEQEVTDLGGWVNCRVP